MNLHTNWHASWRPWTSYVHAQTGKAYESRSRALYVGRLQIATLVQSTLRPKAPFYMYATGDRKITVSGTSMFHVVRQFMRQLKGPAP